VVLASNGETMSGRFSTPAAGREGDLGSRAWSTSMGDATNVHGCRDPNTTLSRRKPYLTNPGTWVTSRSRMGT
jgi:hypothetical protein